LRASGLQGIGGALIMANSTPTLIDVFPPRRSGPLLRHLAHAPELRAIRTQGDDRSCEAAGPPSTDHFDALAATGTVPFATRLTGADLRAVLASGEIPAAFRAHIERVLAEAPIEMLAAVIHTYPSGPARETALRHLRDAAVSVGASGRIDRWLSG
jgi:hypothetical protein